MIKVEKVIEAIYENGVFRPKTPINLKEGQIVRVVLPDLFPINIQKDKNLRRHFGVWGSGNSNSADNDDIDADLE